MKKDDTTQTHPSYAVVSWNKSTYGGKGACDLFGTSIDHHSTVVITIESAEVHRNLNNDYVHPINNIIEIEMSPDQFSEFITSPGRGVGTTCTLRRLQGQSIAGKEVTSIRQVFDREFKDNLLKIAENFNPLSEHINNLRVSEKEKQSLRSKVFEIKRIIEDHIPFMQTQFNERLDATVNEAKQAVESFVEDKVRSVGIKAIQNPNLLLLEGESNAN